VPTSHTSISGNLTRDPEIRYTREGRVVATLGIAIEHRYQQNGEWESETSFLDATCWGELAENVALSLTKGARVMLTGRLRLNVWDQDGERRSKVELVVEDIGPSLRWATAEVSRMDRHGMPGPDRSARSDLSDDPAAQ
jgi:single-strand DNA-binding protein